MTGEFHDFDSLPEPEAEPITEERILECLRRGAESARALKKQFDAIPPPDMNLVLR